MNLPTNKTEQRAYLETQIPILKSIYTKCKQTYQSCVVEHHLNTLEVLQLQAKELLTVSDTYYKALADLQALNMQFAEFNETCAALFMCGVKFETDKDLNIVII